MVQCCDIGICKDGDPARVRYRFNKEVLSLPVQVGRHQTDTRNVAAWPGERSCKPRGDHIFGHDNQRNGFGRLLKFLRNEVSRDHNRVRRGFDNGRHRRSGLLVVESEAVKSKFEVLALAKALRAQFIEKGQRWRLVASRTDHDGNAIDATRLLRLGRKRPHSCTANKNDEVAPPHSAPSKQTRDGSNFYRRRKRSAPSIRPQASAAATDTRAAAAARRRSAAVGKRGAGRQGRFARRRSRPEMPESSRLRSRAGWQFYCGPRPQRLLRGCT